MSTRRLAEFLAALSGFRDERSAIQGAAERAAETLRNADITIDLGSAGSSAWRRWSAGSTRSRGAVSLADFIPLADATVAKLQALKALGVRLAVDDFGTGCDLGQGFCFAKPLSAPEAEDLIRLPWVAPGYPAAARWSLTQEPSSPR